MTKKPSKATMDAIARRMAVKQRWKNLPGNRCSAADQKQVSSDLKTLGFELVISENVSIRA